MGHQRDRVRRPDTHDVPSPVLGTGVETRRQGVRDHVLSLQRRYGNTAVISVLQRDKAASTNAPGYKAPPKTQAEPDYFPTSRNYPSWDSSKLQGWIKDHPGTKEEILAWEDLWMIGSDRLSIAMQLGRSYGARGDEKRSVFWYKVSHREIKPRDPDDQTGKGD